MSGVFHPHALVLALNYPTTVDDCQLAIVQAEGDLELAEAIVRVYCMAGVWPDIQRMKRNLETEARLKRDGEIGRLLIPNNGGAILQ